MTRGRLLAGLGVIALVALAFAAGARFSTAAETGSSSDGPPEASAPAADEARDVRPELARTIERTIDELGPGIDRAELEALLERLEAQARARGDVTALEVEPGVAAIEAAAGAIGASEAEMLRLGFLGRMERLAAELRDEPEPTRERPEPILATIADAPANERRALVESYLAAVDALPPEEQQMAMARLDAVIAAPSEPFDPRALVAAVEGAETPEERERATAELMQRLGELPPEEQRRLLEELP